MFARAAAEVCAPHRGDEEADVQLMHLVRQDVVAEAALETSMMLS